MRSEPGASSACTMNALMEPADLQDHGASRFGTCPRERMHQLARNLGTRIGRRTWLLCGPQRSSDHGASRFAGSWSQQICGIMEPAGLAPAHVSACTIWCEVWELALGRRRTWLLRGPQLSSESWTRPIAGHGDISGRGLSD